MEIQYQHQVEGINWQEVSDLFKSVGWNQRDPKDICDAFSKSSYVRFAFVQDPAGQRQLVGCGRTLDDGKFYAMIVDLAILPAFQGQCIGSNILASLKDELESFSFTTLTAAIGKERFYEKQGWRKQRSAFIWPRSTEQEMGHCEPLENPQ
jgi:aralkylamine N-acetyltransferase